MRKLLLFVPLAILGVVGCGGSESLGYNSKVQVDLTSRWIEDLSLIISPLNGGPNDPNACRENAPGFGCSAFLGDGVTSYQFTTNSEASTQPYRVYVRTFRTADTRFGLDVYMDNEIKYTIGWEIWSGETLFMARIFRNNAGSSGAGRGIEASVLSADGTRRRVEPVFFKTKAELNAWIAKGS